MSDLVCSGWLTVDDIVLEDGTCHRGVQGGGALYSAVGAQIWAGSVGVHAPAGKPHFARSRSEIAARGLDVSGIACGEGKGLELWMLHESEVHKQQIRRLGSSHPEEMDAVRGPLPDAYRRAHGIHIAPQGPASSLSALGAMRRPGRVMTMDILADAMIDASRYADLAYLGGLDAFLPSEAEIFRIWNPAGVEDWVAQTALTTDCLIVAKVGASGSILAEPRTGRLVSVPALQVTVADATGAGDAYCGGFLAGLVQGMPAVDCAAMGTVSASFVVEAVGALATGRPSVDERDDRFARVMDKIVSL
ncbi:PfkB family carbohydrate kinase [uncultured Limimaricola sp.]|uniref:carbohydrate kinase family protein n=1 Tax=uncultured Limimaricola sp. TaxID=2211667 RepID=UPI0030F9D26B